MTTGVGTGRGARSGEWRRVAEAHGRPLPPIFPLELCPSFTTAGTVGLPPSFLLAPAAVDCYIVRAQVRPNPPCVASPLASLLRSSRECAVSARRHASPRLPEETHAVHASVGSHTRDNATVSMRTCTFLVVCARLPEACMPLRRRVTVCSCLRLMYRCTPPAALRPVRAPPPPPPPSVGVARLSAPLHLHAVVVDGGEASASWRSPTRRLDLRVSLPRTALSPHPAFTCHVWGRRGRDLPSLPISPLAVRRRV